MGLALKKEPECNDGVERRLITTADALPPDICVMGLREMNAAVLHRMIMLMKNSDVQAVMGQALPPSQAFRDATTTLGHHWERDHNESTFHIESERQLKPEELHGVRKYLGNFLHMQPLRGTFFKATEARDLFYKALQESHITEAFKRAGRPDVLEEWLKIPMQGVNAVADLWPDALVNFSIDGTLLNAYMTQDYGLHYHLWDNDLNLGDRERFKLLHPDQPGFYLNYPFEDYSTIFASRLEKVMVGGRGWNWNAFTTIGHTQGGSLHTGPVVPPDHENIQRSVFIARVYPGRANLFPDFEI